MHGLWHTWRLMPDADTPPAGRLGQPACPGDADRPHQVDGCNLPSGWHTSSAWHADVSWPPCLPRLPALTFCLSPTPTHPRFPLQEVMSEPVVAEDGFSYERAVITAWMASHDRSPMTGAKLRHKMLVPNHVLRAAIQDWRAQQAAAPAGAAAGQQRADANPAAVAAAAASSAASGAAELSQGQGLGRVSSRLSQLSSRSSSSRGAGEGVQQVAAEAQAQEVGAPRLVQGLWDSPPPAAAPAAHLKLM